MASVRCISISCFIFFANLHIKITLFIVSISPTNKMPDLAMEAATSTLLSLPAELRFMIYDYATGEHDRWGKSGRRIGKHVWRTPCFSWSSNSVKLSRTC